MEYISNKPNHLSKYVDHFHNSVKQHFELALTNVYKDEINQYSEVIEHIVKLPFIQAILNENKLLKENIQGLQLKLDSLLSDNSNRNKVVLEIVDLPSLQPFQNLDSVL